MDWIAFCPLDHQLHAYLAEGIALRVFAHCIEGTLGGFLNA